jgi:hypothetical protein
VPEGLAEHVADVDRAHGAAGHAGDLEHRQPAGVGDLDLDLLVVELVRPQPAAEGFARRGRGTGADERIEHALLGRLLGLHAHLLAAHVAHERDADLDEVAHDRFHVAADVADLGELRRLDLEERRAGKPGEPPRDLGLAHSRGADHKDVLGQHLLAQLALELLAAPAVAQRDGDGALGVVLADDVAVELGDDLARRKGGHRVPQVEKSFSPMIEPIRVTRKTSRSVVAGSPK